jgi:dipeptidyl aminopeptidase/acylaminoacyl peptidase
MTLKHFFLLYVPIVFLVACGGASTPNEPNNPNNPGGNPSRYTGTLIAEGTGYAHTLDLSSNPPTSPDPWVSRDTVSVYEAASVVLSQNELFIASDSFGSPLTVEVKDLTTFGLKETFEWEYDENVGRVNELAVSQDGKYLAALVEALGPQYLEVLERDGKSVVYSGLDIVSSNIVWTSDNKLVFALSLASENNPERWGAIGAIPLERFLTATNATIDIDLYATFNRAEWELGVGGVGLSRDNSQLVYTRGSDLWVMDFTPGATSHQLTTGPVYKDGAQFSPDGKFIAFTAGSQYGSDETYIVPNHRSEPLFITYGQSGDEYLIGEDTLVDAMLAWKE